MAAVTTDHPRSRGVYSDVYLDRSDALGSSPLARGLPVLVDPTDLDERIIPARAGFTRRCRPREGGQRDHPRSRGVYETLDDYDAMTQGSSPLARGLRDLRRGEDARTGIIPARAGFTKTVNDRLSIQQDHPRSRGVYRLLPSALIFVAGSSPLARGLPGLMTTRADGAGIIPARAGFTLK